MILLKLILFSNSDILDDSALVISIWLVVNVLVVDVEIKLVILVILVILFSFLVRLVLDERGFDVNIV